MKALAQFPLVKWALVHPRLAAWIALSVGMVVLLIIDLLPLQWVALVTACILVAGACIWIVSWEDQDEDETPADPADKPTPPSVS
jgi:hypothetical protein